MKKLKQLFMALALVVGVSAPIFVPTAVGAVNVDPLGAACAENPNSEVCKSSDDNISDIIITVVNVLLYIVGILSVIMIIIGGIMYAISAGDSGTVTRAKNTLLYAIVGLAVAFFAYAIVNWVIDRFV